MFKFNEKVLAHVKKPNKYELRPLKSDDYKKQVLQQALIRNPKLFLSNLNASYGQLYDMILRQREQKFIKLQNSILWSPKFTPWQFKYWFMIPSCLVICLMCYIRYIVTPRRMLHLKAKYNTQFPDLQRKGWLDGWLDEMYRKDKILQFQAYTVKDLQKLYDQGLLMPESEQQQKQQAQKMKKRSKKFARGDKQFILQQFTTT